MKNQPDTGIDTVHTRLAVAVKQPEEYGPWAIDRILAECPDPECEECAKIVCPGGDPMHFHHDGCPYCAGAWADKWCKPESQS